MCRIFVNQWFALKDAGIPLLLPEPEFANRAVGGLSGATYSVAQSPKLPAKQKLNTLPNTATTPDDHLKLAAFYEQEAARLNDKASLHQPWRRSMAKDTGRVIVQVWLNAMREKRKRLTC